MCRDSNLPLAQRQAGWSRLQMAYLAVGDEDARQLLMRELGVWRMRQIGKRLRLLPSADSEYWARVKAAGKDNSPYRAGFAQTIIVAETDEEAERDYREHVDYFYNRCLHVYPGFADAPGYRTIKTLQANVTNQMTEQALGNVASLSWQQLLDDGYVIAGSPETVIKQMRELIHGLHVGNIFCLIHIGNMPEEKCRRSMKLFAEKVIPQLRNEFPEFAKDDRFWVHPLEQQAARRSAAAVGAK